MFGTKPFDLLDIWKGNQIPLMALNRAINDYDWPVTYSMIDLIQNIMFLPSKKSWLNLLIGRLNDDDFERIDYALSKYNFDIPQDSNSKSSILTKLW